MLKATNNTAKLIADPGAIVVKAGAAEGEKKGPPTFEGIAYSGGVVSRSTLSKPLDADYVIDLAGMTEARGVKANLDHKSTQRVGHLTATKNTKKELHVSGVLSAATSHRDEVALSAADGFGWDVSIEAGLSAARKLAKGKSETVNGREVAGPLWIFDKSTLTGLGFVSNGADQGNSITIAASAEPREITLREWRESGFKTGN